MAVNSILLSKTFHNGMICASEQTVIAVESAYNKVRKEFEDGGAYILKKDEVAKVGNVILVNGALNANIVGQPVYKIAELAGIKVPETAKVLIGEVESVGIKEPFAHEKLSPVLGLYKGKSFDDALAKAVTLVEYGGFGHTSSLFVDEMKCKDKIAKFSAVMKTCRTLINTPSAHGGIGDLFNFKLNPSLTLGCGSWGGNSVLENIGPQHLINVKNVAERRENMFWFRVPEKVYFKYGCLLVALKELKDLNKKRAFIVTDKVLYQLGYVDKVIKVLDEIGVNYKIFTDVEPDPTLATAKKVLNN